MDNMRDKYTVKITETIVKSFVVEADSKEEAAERAQTIYDTNQLKDYCVSTHLNSLEIKAAPLVDIKRLPNYKTENEESLEE